MSPPKRPMPPRPSALGRPPSFAPGPRAPVKPLAPLAPLSSHASNEYADPDLLDGPTVTSFEPPDAEFEPRTHDDPTHLAADDYPPPAPRSVPPPRPSYRPQPSRPPASVRPAVPAPRHTPPARAAIPAAPRSVPPPRPSFPAPRASGAGAARSVPPAANPFLAPSQAPPPVSAMFDDVNTAFVGGANMAPDFGALEARVSRPDWNKHMDAPSPEPMRQRAHSIDMGEGVVVETLAGFEVNRSNKSELSEAWRPEGLPHSDVLEKPNVMRLESLRPQVAHVPSHAPMHLGYTPGMPGAPRVSNPPPGGRAPAPSIDLHAEAARANQGRVRLAYIVAGISILLLLVAILSAVLSTC